MQSAGKLYLMYNQSMSSPFLLLRYCNCMVSTQLVLMSAQSTKEFYFLANVIEKSIGSMSKSFRRLLVRYLVLYIYKINLHYKGLESFLIRDDS